MGRLPLDAQLNFASAGRRLYVLLAFSTVAGVFLLAGTLLVGLSSYFTADKDREWWARSGGMLLALALAWPLFAVIVLYGGDLLGRLRMPWQASGGLTALVGWTASQLGRSSDTASGRRS